MQKDNTSLFNFEQTWSRRNFNAKDEFKNVPR